MAQKIWCVFYAPQCTVLCAKTMEQTLKLSFLRAFKLASLLSFSPCAIRCILVLRTFSNSESLANCVERCRCFRLFCLRRRP